MAKNYSNKFSDNGFWSKLVDYASDIGSALIFKALCLYHVTKKPEVPAWAKATAIGALGYLISPIDGIPDFTPVVGYSDDAGVIAAALGTLAIYIDDEVEKAAKKSFKSIFGKTYNKAA